MHLTYLPGIDLVCHKQTEELLEVPAEEVAHLKVLRLKPGDAISVTNGSGVMGEAEIFDFIGKHCLIKLLDVHLHPPKPYEVHLAVAPTKNIARYEWFIEKATEIGIDSITPLWCDHSERAHLRVDRLQKVAIAAMKQSLKSWLPVINKPIKLDDYLSNYRTSGQRFIAWIDDSVNDHLKNCIMAKTAVSILIGPEGDFSRREVALAVEHHFRPVTLGRERLRTETAALVACHIVNLLNQ
ncbi:MAG: 16S rRNA (uracil(1498)-N(3))-methyltransferase [Lentimicrobium sp.]|jgi:16S rRNA (uracil1498-N3)-methyltransferase|nr:16S rRNA (uracil(1498)-N(3))-methyltransferase [Lentimicrobium sp.]